MPERPTVGRLTVPFMVDSSRTPIDFKAVDHEAVAKCATEGRCGICGGRIRKGPIAFIGPDDGRTCYADPWMHDECADLALEQCPFLGGRRDWREGVEPSLQPYSDGMVKRIAWNWRAHREGDVWHFEAL